MTGYEALNGELHSALDPHLRAHLSDDDALELAAIVHQARETHSAELEESVAAVLSRIPSLLRGAVRKLADL